MLYCQKVAFTQSTPQVVDSEKLLVIFLHAFWCLQNSRTRSEDSPSHDGPGHIFQAQKGRSETA